MTPAQPARRIVSLAPHATELLYAAGGGDRIVGTVSYSDYLPQARDLPRVGDNKALDLERIAALKPDLIVVWRHHFQQGVRRQLACTIVQWVFSAGNLSACLFASSHALSNCANLS